jgi:hypothetical protein
MNDNMNNEMNKKNWRYKQTFYGWF